MTTLVLLGFKKRQVTNIICDGDASQDDADNKQSKFLSSSRLRMPLNEENSWFGMLEKAPLIIPPAYLLALRFHHNPK